ncbi:MAG TPA: hypothetical protein VM695_07960 [Phycisphaerae bacterium]|nr:hypothetical protein [Phycisphaerae bacterium]
MVAGICQTIRHPARRLTYQEACDLAGRAESTGSAAGVLIDLRETRDTTVGALARLVVLRRDLLRRGCDLRITGLCGRARILYEVNHLAALLPSAGETAAG